MESGKNGDPGGIRTPDPQIRNVGDGAENRQLSNISAEIGPSDIKGLADRWEKEGECLSPRRPSAYAWYLAHERAHKWRYPKHMIPELAERIAAELAD